MTTAAAIIEHSSTSTLSGTREQRDVAPELFVSRLILLRTPRMPQ